ncbi:hypothetical protein I7I53_01905 [Histoplasma capsulatum var. duboisii H88]|uniref:Uncharacterized protein n=1 Tax=Ajellomyces capsulatus (strain H88) TaxID=544711 RepID=A0A8A1LP55_AJEC8|nr:hypothetical protein I7I53_01905 [Histoplasma capsulatum var. duboisii H88]
MSFLFFLLSFAVVYAIIGLFRPAVLPPIYFDLIFFLLPPRSENTCPHLLFFSFPSRLRLYFRFGAFFPFIFLPDNHRSPSRYNLEINTQFRS